MAFFFLGFILGLFESARLAGLAMLGISGGFAFGIRMILLKEGLLLSGTSLFAVNWILIALFGVLGGIFITLPKVQRGGIVSLFAIVRKRSLTSRRWIAFWISLCGDIPHIPGDRFGHAQTVRHEPWAASSF